MKVTADTITDEQLSQLIAYHSLYDIAVARGKQRASRGDSRKNARARCADAWNARHGTDGAV